jgi:hypothetical protein
MEYAQRMGCSSTIASAIFKALPDRFKASWMYRAFVGEAMGMFKQQMAYDEVFAVLWERYAAEFAAGYAEEKAFAHVMPREQMALFLQHLTPPAYKRIVIYPHNKITGPYPTARGQTDRKRLSRYKPRERRRAP